MSHLVCNPRQVSNRAVAVLASDIDLDTTATHTSPVAVNNPKQSSIDSQTQDARRHWRGRCRSVFTAVLHAALHILCCVLDLFSTALEILARTFDGVASCERGNERCDECCDQRFHGHSSQAALHERVCH